MKGYGVQWTSQAFTYGAVTRENKNFEFHFLYNKVQTAVKSVKSTSDFDDRSMYIWLKNLKI